MQKCPKCGKKFDSLNALTDHFRAVHPNQRFVAPKCNTSRNFVVYLVIVIIVMSSLVGYLIYSQHTTTTGVSTALTTFTSGGSTVVSTITSVGSVLSTPISYALYQNLTTVSDGTLTQVGLPSGVVAPTAIAGTPITFNNKPEILYIGAEFCPLCAANRWSMVVALSKFGNFSNVEYMISAVGDGNYSTLSFRNAS